MRVRVWVVWWIACVLWSGTYVFIKLGLADVPPLSFAWVRLVVALGVLLPITLSRRLFTGLSTSSVLRMFWAGVLLLGVNYGLLYWGAQLIPSGLVAILQSTTPTVALLLGWLIGSERVTWRKVLAFAAGSVGVVLIFGSEASASGLTALAGSVAVLCSSACIAAAYVWMKGHHTGTHPLALVTIQCVTGALVLAPVGLAVEGSPLSARWSGEAVAALIYLAVCGSVVAFWLNYWLLARMDTSAMLIMGIAEVPIAIGLGAAVFAERLPPGTFAGTACVLLGTIMLSRQK